MYGVAGPVQAFTIASGRVEDLLEILNALCRSIETENPFDIGGWDGD